MQQYVKCFLFGLLPFVLSIPLFILYFVPLWLGPQMITGLTGGFLLICWGILSAKLLDKQKKMLPQLLCLHFAAMAATIAGVLDQMQGSMLAVIGQSYYQAIWPLLIQVTILFDANVTAYYSQTPWTVYVVGLMMALISSAIGMAVKRSKPEKPAECSTEEEAA